MEKIYLIIAITGTGSFLWVSCGTKRRTYKQQSIAIPVTVVQAKLEQTNYYDEYPGTITR